MIPTAAVVASRSGDRRVYTLGVERAGRDGERTCSEVLAGDHRTGSGRDTSDTSSFR